MRRYSAVRPLEPKEAHSSRRSPVMAAWPAASSRVAFGAEAGGVPGAVGVVGVVGFVGVVCVGAGGAAAILVRRVLVPPAVLTLIDAWEPERAVAVPAVSVPERRTTFLALLETRLHATLPTLADFGGGGGVNG